MKSLNTIKFSLLCLFFCVASLNADVISISKKGKGLVALNMQHQSTALSKLVYQGISQSGYFTMKKEGAYQVEFKELDGSSFQIKIEQHKEVIPKGYFKQTISGLSTEEKALVIADTIIERILGKGKAYLRSRIAFSARTSNGNKEIYSVDPLGNQLKKITSYNTITVEPEWSPDNKLMNYVVYAGSAIKVVQREMSSGRHRVLAKFKGLNSSASFSPDGRYLALTLSKDKQIDLYYLNAKNPSKGGRLSFNGDVEASPVWSPDSQSILYVSSTIARNGKIGRPLLYMMNVKSKKSRRLFRDGVERVSPAWSSKNAKIAYSKRHRGRYVIATCHPGDAKGTEEVLTDLIGDWEAPSWAPNGRHLICTRELNGKRDLYIIDSKTGTRRKLSIPVTKPSLADWSSLSR